MNLGNRLCPQKQNEPDNSFATIDIQGKTKHMMAEEEPGLADPHTRLLAGVEFFFVAGHSHLCPGDFGVCAMTQSPLSDKIVDAPLALSITGVPVLHCGVLDVGILGC